MAEIFKINGQNYECEFKLSNPDGQEASFTKSAVKAMSIVDNWFEPFISGSITIANPYEYVEDKYFIRGDGRDELLIKFKPEEQNWKNEEFEHTFVLIDDSSSGNIMTRAENYRTFEMVSKDAIKFMDTIPYNTVFNGKVGAILKEIFKKLLGEDKVDEQKWEDGDFTITYYPPSTFKYLDVLRYFLGIYYAKDDDIYVKGFIHFNDEIKKYQLDLLSKVFKNNKNYELEAFGLGDLVSEVGFDNPNNPQAGPPTSEYAGGIKNLGYSTPMYTYTTDYFINSLVFGYDRIFGQQKIAKLNFDDVKKRWAKKFVEGFKSMSGKPKPFAIKNNTTDKKFKKFSFPYPVEDNVKIVEAEMHNALTFYNLQVNFASLGNASRVSGKFIDIYSPKKLENPSTDSLKSDEKLLGRWFVTETRHVFLNDQYQNQIFATKTFIGPNSKIKEDVE